MEKRRAPKIFNGKKNISDLLGAGPLPEAALQTAQLPFQHGGLNIRSAVALAPVASQRIQDQKKSIHENED